MMQNTISGFSKLTKIEKIDWLLDTYFNDNDRSQKLVMTNIGIRTRNYKNYMMNLLKIPSPIFTYPLALHPIF